MSPLRRIHISLLVILIGAFALSPGLATAKTSFEKEQKAFVAAKNSDFYSMTGSLNKIVAYYADSDDPRYWSDRFVFNQYSNYLDSLVSYVERVDRFWKRTSKTYSSKRSSVQKRISKSRQRFSECRASRSLIRSARGQVGAARALFGIAKTAYRGSKNQLEPIKKASLTVANLIAIPDEIRETDGYEDDQVYEFGSKRIIVMPNSPHIKVEIDPELIAPIIEALFEYDDEIIDIEETKFEASLLRATKALKKINDRC